MRQFGAEGDAASISFHLNAVLLTFMVNGMGNTWRVSMVIATVPKVTY